MDGKGEHAHLIRGLTVDVTEQRAVEEHLRQSHRLEAVGQLAGGIAHDFNNLLTVIIGLSGLALTAGEKKSREHLEEIASAGRQASELVARLLAFSRMQAVEPRLVDLNEVVGSSRKLLAQLLGERIDLLTDLEPGPLPIVADPGQLEQIVINLAMNARDAMPGRGGLTIHTERIVDGEPRVSLAIEDTGHGMDERTRERIFDPFFTTKEPGKGTGLGLSIVHGIVEQAGGEISVDSEPGRGTRVTVVMPRAETAPEPLGGPRGEVAAHDEGRRVLLVEDNDPVRRTASLMLADAGFVVVAVADGEQALRLLETGASFDVVVTDQVMPRLLGTELAARIWACEPAMPVLFTSAQLSLGDELSLAGSPARVLWKPYTGPELASAIDGLLRDTVSLAPVVSLLGEAEPTA